MEGGSGDVSSTSGHSATVRETLDELVHKGGSLQAEVLELANELPPAFKVDAKSEFSSVLFDFKYLGNPAPYEQKIANNRNLYELNKKARETFMQVVETAFDLFQRIVAFYESVSDFLKDVAAGKYVQSSLEAILQDHVRRVSLIEVLYCNGTVFLMADRCLPGPTRERLLVSYCRYKEAVQDIPEKWVSVSRLCQRTGYVPGQKHMPQGYPEDYLRRFPLPDSAIRLALGHLVSGDMYSTLPHYPDPSHRSTALSHHAGYVFVLLFYVPHILNRDAKAMQTIVDRFFPDRWMIGWGPRSVADMRYEWERYKAARSALKNALPTARVRRLVQQYWDRVSGIVAELGRYLRAGGLQADTLLQGSSDIFSLIREANVTARWILLHNFSTTKDAGPEYYGEDITKLVLNLAGLEYEVRRLYKELLDSRKERRDRACQIVKENLRSLSDMHQTPPLGSNIKRNTHLAYWLQCLEWEVESLGKLGEREAAEKLRSLLRAFDDMGHFWPLESVTPGSRKLVHDIRVNLTLTQQLVNIRPELLETLRIVGEFAYAFKLMHTKASIKQIQSITGREPQNLWKLGCLLLKMRSAMDIPIFRGKSGNREPPVAVVHHFESMFLSFGKAVFEHIPGSVCQALDQMALIHAHALTQKRGNSEKKNAPVKLGRKKKSSEPDEDKDKLAKSESTEAYTKLAKLAARIAQFSKGVAAVEACLKNVVSLNLHQQLEDRVRRHVAKRLAALGNQKLHFNFQAPPFAFRGAVFGGRPFGSNQGFSGTMPGTVEFGERLLGLQDALGGYCQALECVQDCLDVPGFGLWQDEVANVIAVNLRKEIRWMHSMKEAERKGELSKGSSEPDGAFTFLGRLCREIIRLTSPFSTHFSVCSCCWLDSEGNGAFGIQQVENVRKCMGSQGLAALDTLLAARVAQLINKLHDFCDHVLCNPKGPQAVSAFAEEMQDCEGLDFPGTGATWYVDALDTIGSKAWNPLLDLVAAIGQSQLLRRQFALELRNGCMLDAPVPLQRALGGLSEYVAERILAECNAHSPVASVEPPPNQFLFQDSMDSAPGSPGTTLLAESQHDSKSVEKVGNSDDPEVVQDVEDSDCPGPGSWTNPACIPPISESLLPSEDTSTVQTNGSERRGSQNSVSTVDVVQNGDVASGNGDSAPLTAALDVLALSPAVPVDSELHESASGVGLSTISEDGLARLSFLDRGLTDGSEPSTSSRPPGTDSLYEVDAGRRGALRHGSGGGQFGSWGSRGPSGRYRKSRSGAEFRRSEGSSSARTATSVSNSSFWDPGSSVRNSTVQFPSMAASETSSGVYSARLGSRASSKWFAQSQFSSFGGSFFAPVQSSFELDESVFSMGSDSPTAFSASQLGVFGVLQGTGFLDPMSVRYISESQPPHENFTIVLFLATISILHDYEFHQASASLMRSVQSSVPDAASFVTGVVTILFQYNPEVTDQFLQYIGQYIRAYLVTATGSIAQGMAAVGVEVALPEEVKRTVGFVSEMCKVGGWSQERAEKFIPPFLLDAWMLGYRTPSATSSQMS